MCIYICICIYIYICMYMSGTYNQNKHGKHTRTCNMWQVGSNTLFLYHAHIYICIHKCVYKIYIYIWRETYIQHIYISIHLCMHITYTPTSLSLYIYTCCIDSIHVHTDIQHALYMWGGCYAQSRTLLVQYEIVWRLSGPSPGWGLQWIPSANRLSCSCSNDWHILCCNVRHRTYNHNNAQQ